MVAELACAGYRAAGRVGFMMGSEAGKPARRENMKKLALALALALAISPLTFAKKTTNTTSAKKSTKMHKKGKNAKKTAWRKGPNGVKLYKL